MYFVDLSSQFLLLITPLEQQYQWVSISFFLALLIFNINKYNLSSPVNLQISTFFSHENILQDPKVTVAIFQVPPKKCASKQRRPRWKEINFFIMSIPRGARYSWGQVFIIMFCDVDKNQRQFCSVTFQSKKNWNGSRAILSLLKPHYLSSTEMKKYMFFL